MRDPHAVYKKWRIPGTDTVVVLSDFKKFELFSVDKNMPRQEQFEFLSPHMSCSPNRDLDMPLPAEWEPVPHFKSLEQFDKELSMWQENSMTDELALMSTGMSAIATFRDGGGEASGVEPGPNGEAVREAPVGSLGEAGAVVPD